jgi:hypothetical protein
VLSTIHPFAFATSNVVFEVLVIPVNSYTPVEITLPSRIFLSVVVKVSVASSF